MDVAEAASISKLPSVDTSIRRRNTTLTGQQSRLAAGIEMAMAIAPPDTATRILLISEGNETEGDLKEAARTAAANKIPIDVLPLEYRYESEVLFKRLVAPPHARSGQTVSLRFVLNSTADVTGKLLLTLNDKPVDLVPDSPEMAVPVELKAGTNVKTVSIPVGTRGMHKFEAVFMPDDPKQDAIAENNRASAMTYVAGPGHVPVVDADNTSAQVLMRALQGTDMEIRYVPAAGLPDNLAMLMDTDAIVLANVDCGSITYQQQEMLCRYVNDLGGGLVMVGGPNSFGAGGWIGSPLADVLPVDLDPPQKKQLPKGALVLIMHACEMPDGNYWGKKVAASAVGTLSRLDLVGILSYNWGGTDDWVYPSGPGGRQGAGRRRDRADADGRHAEPARPPAGGLQRAGQMRCGPEARHHHQRRRPDPAVGATAEGPRRGEDHLHRRLHLPPFDARISTNLQHMASATGGRYYDVKDAQALPQIFIKEAQVVRRSLIVEETFSPQVVYSLSETLKGMTPPLPTLDGYVLTGPKGGLSQLVLATHQADPLLATCQSGLGRCVAFTSSADSRWAGQWLQWADFARFWEQVVRWAGKPAQSTDCEIFTDVEGQQATVNVEAFDTEGKFLQLAAIEGQVLTPEMKGEPLQLAQTGPGPVLRPVPCANVGQLHREPPVPQNGTRREVPSGERRRQRAVRPGVPRPLGQRAAAEGGQQDDGRAGPVAGVRPEQGEPVRPRGPGVSGDAPAFAAAADAGVDCDLPAGRGGPAGDPQCAGGPAKGQGLGALHGQTGAGPDHRPAAGAATEVAGAVVRAHGRHDRVEALRGRGEVPGRASEHGAETRDGAAGEATGRRASRSSKPPQEGTHIDQLLKAKRKERRGSDAE